MISYELSKAFFGYALRRLGAELEGVCVGGVFNPLVCRGESRQPGGRGLKNSKSEISSPYPCRYLNPRQCTPIFIARTCMGFDATPPPRVSKVRVVELSEKNSRIFLDE